MHILILGGTAWLGRELTQTAVAAGHTVTCMARRDSVVPGATAVRADRNMAGAYDAVAAQRWDAIIDLAREPGHVRSATAALASTTGLYVFVSTCSVYADQHTLGQDESAALVPALVADAMESPAQYGEAKVACEEAVLAAFGAEHALIIRPGLIGGPGDPSGRTTYWPWRFAHPATEDGTVLIPDAPAQPSSIVDVRDLAEWAIASIERTLVGVFNVTGDSIPLGSHLAAARDVSEHASLVLAAAPEWLTAQGVVGWGGPRSLPIWLDDPADAGIHAHSNERAREVGLQLRTIEDTLRDGLEAREFEEPLKPAGLTDEEERELIFALTVG